MITEQQLKNDYRKMYEREVKYLRWYKKLLELGFEKEQEYDDFSIFFGAMFSLFKKRAVSIENLIEVLKESEFLFGSNSKILIEILSSGGTNERIN